MALEGFDLEYGFNRDVFRALPTLSRATVQRDADGLRCRLLPPDHGDVVEYASSGSTGRPVKVLGTRLHDLWWRALLLRDHFWHGRDFSAKLAVLKTHSTDGTRANWGAATHGVIETGPLCQPEQHPRHCEPGPLARGAPRLRLSHATNLRALAEHCLAQGIRLPDLREARSFGEMLSADLRGLVAAAWEVPVTDSYSAAEVGIIALQCPLSGDLHVQAEHVLVEILRADGHTCLPGEVGRVVVTALHNFAMPLVRYELGDYAEVGAPCPCGRGLPVIKRIVGRRAPGASAGRQPPLAQPAGRVWVRSHPCDNSS